MSTRRLAGTRRNKHLPIARRTIGDDRTVARSEAASIRWLAARDGMGRTIAALFHDPAQGSKPNHAARAADIHTIWAMLPDRDATRQLKAAIAGAKGKSAAPMTDERRADAYLAQVGPRRMTDRQMRQYQRMGYRNALLATA